MYSKVKLFGHPVHPMLIAYPVAFYTATLAALVVYAFLKDQFWLRVAILTNVVAVVAALVAAVPGFIDWATGIPRGHPGKRTGFVHLLLNTGALALFTVTLFMHIGAWSSTGETGVGAGIVLSAIGVGLTAAAGFYGYKLIQVHHVGVRLSREQEALEGNRHSRAA